MSGMYDKVLKELADGAEWREVKDFVFKIQDDGSLAVIYKGCGKGMRIDKEEIEVNVRRMRECVKAIKRVVEPSHYGWPKGLDYEEFIKHLPKELKPYFGV